MKYVRPWTLFINNHKYKDLRGFGRFLGLDVGVAVSDPENKIALPLSVIPRKKATLSLMAEDFKSLMSEYNVKGFIIRYPYNDVLQHHHAAVQVDILINDLCKRRKLEGFGYTFWDERYTSKNVEFLVKPLRCSRDTAKPIIDKLAARDTWIISTRSLNPWKQTTINASSGSW